MVCGRRHDLSCAIQVRLEPTDLDGPGSRGAGHHDAGQPNMAHRAGRPALLSGHRRALINRPWEKAESPPRNEADSGGKRLAVPPTHEPSMFSPQIQGYRRLAGN